MVSPPVSGSHTGCVSAAAASGMPWDSRKVDPGGGALADLAQEGDGSAALADDAVCRGQPQTSAAPGILGGEEGLEQVALRIAGPCRHRYR